METGKGKPKGVEFWNAHIASFKASGISANEYCKRKKISRSSFHSYVSKSQLKKSTSSQSAFIEILPSSCAKSSVVTTSSAIVIVSMHIPMGTPIGDLAALVKALQ